MTEDQPIWRQMFDAMEKPLREPAEALINTEAFSRMLMFAGENWNSLNEATREGMAKLMHLSNVPAYTDLTRLSRQVGTLTGKVDTLSGRIEAMAETLEDVRALLGQTTASGAGRSGPEAGA